MEVKAIVLDFDGVIADTYREGLKRITLIASSHGVPCDDAFTKRLRQHWGVNAEKFVKLTCEVSDEKAKEIYQEWETYDSENQVPFIENAHTLIHDLKAKGYRLGMLTSRWRESLNPTLERAGIKDAFDCIVSHDDTEYHKPDGRAFDPLLEHFATFGISKNEIIYVGDTYVDIEAGRNAGIHTLIVETGPYRDHHYLTHPHPEEHILSDFTALTGWLAK